NDGCFSPKRRRLLRSTTGAGPEPLAAAGVGSRSGPQRQRAAVTAARGPMDHHPVVKSRDGLAPGTDEETWDQRMDQAGQRGGQQRDPEAERMALMLQIGLSHRARMVEE